MDLLGGILGLGAGLAVGIGTGNPFAGIAAGSAVYGGVAGSNAANEQAEAQQRIAQSQLTERQRERQMALGFAAASPAELSARSRLLDLQGQVLGQANRELEFLASGLDARSPGAREAGQGLYSGIISRQRAQQRSLLESNLRRRFGSGYGTSSAGLAALGQFDQQTADIGVQAIPYFLQQAYGAIGETTQLENVLAGRQVNASLGTSVAQFAGAENLGSFLRAQAQGQFASSIGQAGIGALASMGAQGKLSWDWNNFNPFEKSNLSPTGTTV